MSHPGRRDQDEAQRTGRTWRARRRSRSVQGRSAESRAGSRATSPQGTQEVGQESRAGTAAQVQASRSPLRQEEDVPSSSGGGAAMEVPQAPAIMGGPPGGESGSQNPQPRQDAAGPAASRPPVGQDAMDQQPAASHPLVGQEAMDEAARPGEQSHRLSPNSWWEKSRWLHATIQMFALSYQYLSPPSF